MDWDYFKFFLLGIGFILFFIGFTFLIIGVVDDVFPTENGIIDYTFTIFFVVLSGQAGIIPQGIGLMILGIIMLAMAQSIF